MRGMTALRGLLKKEFRFLRTSIFVTGAIVLLYYVGLFVATNYYAAEDVAFFSILPTGIMIWLVPAYLATSLEDERKKLHVWLYNPQAAWKLLGMKFVVSFVASVVLVLLITFGISAFHWTFLSDNALFSSLSWWHFVLLSIGLLLSGSYFSIWFMFGWVLFHVLKRLFKRMSLPVTIGLLIGMVVLLGYIETSGWFTQLAQALSLSLDLPLGIEGQIDGSSGRFEMRVAATDVYVLHFMFHFAIAVLLFLLSCRFIDRNVEV